jgi:hypothetical protein
MVDQDKEPVESCKGLPRDEDTTGVAGALTLRIRVFAWGIMQGSCDSHRANKMKKMRGLPRGRFVASDGQDIGITLASSTKLSQKDVDGVAPFRLWHFSCLFDLDLLVASCSSSYSHHEKEVSIMESECSFRNGSGS